MKDTPSKIRTTQDTSKNQNMISYKPLKLSCQSQSVSDIQKVKQVDHKLIRCHPKIYRPSEKIVNEPKALNNKSIESLSVKKFLPLKMLSSSSETSPTPSHYLNNVKELD